MNEHASYEAPEERRWLKFTFLGGAVVIVLFGFPLAWLSIQFYQVQQRDALFTEIQEKGGYLLLSSEIAGPNQRPWQQEVGRKVFGDSYGEDVLNVVLPDGEIRTLLDSLAPLSSTMSFLQVGKSELDDAQIDRIIDFDLSTISLQDSQIKPDQLPRFGKMPALYEVHLGGAAASDEHLEQLRQMPMVKSLKVEKQHLTEESLKPLLTLPNLSILNFQEIEFESGEEFAPMAKLKGVRHLVLFHMKVDDEVLKHVGQMVAVEGLFIVVTTDGVPEEKSRMTPQGIRQLRNLTKLKGITLIDPNLTDEAIEELTQLPALERLDLGDEVDRTRQNGFGLSKKDNAP